MPTNRNRFLESPLTLFSFQDIVMSVTGIFMLMTLLLAVMLTSRTKATPNASSTVDAQELAKALVDAKLLVAELQASVDARSAQEGDYGDYTQGSASAEAKAVAEEIAILQERIRELRSQQRKVAADVSSAETAWTNRATDIDTRDRLNSQRAAMEEEVTALQNSQRVFYNDTDTSGRQVMLVELFDSDILVAEAGQAKPPKRFDGMFKENSFMEWAGGQSTSRYRFVIVVHPGTTQDFQEISEKLRKKGFTIGYDLLPDDKVAIDIQRGAG